VGRSAKGEGDLACADQREFVAELEGELPFEDVEGFVEGVLCSGGPFAAAAIVLSITATRRALSSLRTRTVDGVDRLDARGELIGPPTRRRSRDTAGPLVRVAGEPIAVEDRRSPVTKREIRTLTKARLCTGHECVAEMRARVENAAPVACSRDQTGAP
jgi:hypothetical protein